MCFNAFAHISRPPETFLQKIFFWPSGVLKNVFWCICAYFQTTRNLKKKKYFLPSEVVKNVFSLFMHLRILREHQKPFFKKYIFYRLEWVKTCFDSFAHALRPPKTCFDAFAHASRPPVTFFQKRYFLPSGVVKNVFACICAHFQTTRIISSKKIFLTVRSA